MTTERRKKAIVLVQVIGVVGSVIVAGFSYLESQGKADKATEVQAAEASAKVDKSYVTLIGAIKHLDETVREQQKVIGDMREAIGELRGALGAVTKANRVLRGEGADAIDRLGGKGRVKQHKVRRPASIRSIVAADAGSGMADMAPAQQIIDLPAQVVVEADVVQGYIQKAQKK